MSSEMNANGEAKFTRLFTVEEANALLPALRPTVEEMLRVFGEIRTEIEKTAENASLPVGSPDLPKHLQERGIAPRLFERVRSMIENIHANGCLVNGPEAGLIDFPALYANEIVFLCWKFGEPGVEYWHRIGEGFSGRRPLLDPSIEEDKVH